MRNKNVLTIVIVLVIIAVTALAAVLLPKLPGTLPENTGSNTRGYVYITAASESRWFELPTEDQPITLRRTKEDGTVIENTIHLTRDGAYMAYSTCENQDCVEQGAVTLENRKERILKNFIICLPNEISIELFSADEIQFTTEE